MYTSLLEVILCLVLSYELAEPHPSSHDGQSLTESVLCSSLPFTHSEPSVPVVTGIPTDVNWVGWQRPVVVLPSSRGSNLKGLS
jgi:hypothetical protein